MPGIDTYQGRGLIADPIHRYILYTRPDGLPSEATGSSPPPRRDRYRLLRSPGR